jgi:hypothetical protein
MVEIIRCSNILSLSSQKIYGQKLLIFAQAHCLQFETCLRAVINRCKFVNFDLCDCHFCPSFICPSTLHFIIFHLQTSYNYLRNQRKKHQLDFELNAVLDFNFQNNFYV